MKKKSFLGLLIGAVLIFASALTYADVPPDTMVAATYGVPAFVYAPETATLTGNAAVPAVLQHRPGVLANWRTACGSSPFCTLIADSAKAIEVGWRRTDF